MSGKSVHLIKNYLAESFYLESYLYKKNMRFSCLFKKSLIGSHPSSIRRAALHIFTFVFIMIFAARNCMLLNKSSFSLEDVSQAPQQCETEGRRTEFHNASPNSTRLKLPCSARIRDMKLILLSILSLIYVWT